MDDAKPRRRRTHSKQLKSEVVAACAEPGASVAAVALARGLNTNLVHKWRRQATRTSGRAVTPRRDETAAVASSAGFVALPLRVADRAIEVELRRGSTMVKVSWPLSAAADCGDWLRELLR